MVHAPTGKPGTTWALKCHLLAKLTHGSSAVNDRGAQRRRGEPGGTHKRVLPAGSYLLRPRARKRLFATFPPSLGFHDGSRAGRKRIRRDLSLRPYAKFSFSGAEAGCPATATERGGLALEMRIGAKELVPLSTLSEEGEARVHGYWHGCACRARSLPRGRGVQLPRIECSFPVGSPIFATFRIEFPEKCAIQNALGQTLVVRAE